MMWNETFSKCCFDESTLYTVNFYVADGYIHSLCNLYKFLEPFCTVVYHKKVQRSEDGRTTTKYDVMLTVSMSHSTKVHSTLLGTCLQMLSYDMYHKHVTAPKCLKAFVPSV